MTRPEEVGMSSERLARIRPAMEKHVSDDKLAGAVTLLARRGEVIHLECVGERDREAKAPMEPDTLFRLYSMTKPITCVALMRLYEQGHLQLADPVSKFIPSFGSLKVYGGKKKKSGIIQVDLDREVTVRDLLTHTSGLTYHFLEDSRVEAIYRDEKVSNEKPLAEFVAGLQDMPLAYQPGSQWRYSFAHDVAAYLIEVLSGRGLDTYLTEEIFEPL
ncbi:MAG: serine hydrolase domain-containing protein, partial [Candidatus Latescibacteria bacterium]|nr:serine hydrolase domain-containing protein [Candidatus Latescibacterota bacterium]